MRIGSKYLNSVACFIMALFFIFILISIVQEDVSQPTPEYWKGVSLSEMGLELIPYCDPVQVSDGPELKFVQTLGATGGVTGIPFTAHVIWSEPIEGSREIIERYGPIDGGDFSKERLITKPDGFKSFNPSVVSGVHFLYLGYMDQSVNTREIWFRAGNDMGWSEAEIVSDVEVDSRSWGARPMAFFDEKSGYELPVVLWFDHRFTAHELLFKSRKKGVDFLGPGRGGFVLEDSDWHPYLRLTDDKWYQFEPFTDWSSRCGDLTENVIHLAYMDSRYVGKGPEPEQRTGNCEIFYKSFRPIGPLIGRDAQENVVPVEQKWEIGKEVQLSFDPGLSDFPCVCGKRFPGNTDLDTAMVVWYETDATGKAEVHYCVVRNGVPDDVRIISPPGKSVLHAMIRSTPIKGHEDVTVVVYPQYEDGESPPIGNSNIYMRIIDGEKISEPIKISDSTCTCAFAGVRRVGYKLEDEVTFLIAWTEYCGAESDFSVGNQIFFRSFELRESRR